jgi:hypothetical protein
MVGVAEEIVPRGMLDSYSIFRDVLTPADIFKWKGTPAFVVTVAFIYYSPIRQAVEPGRDVWVVQRDFTSADAGLQVGRGHET